MKKSLVMVLASVGIFSGCNAVNDALGMSPEDMENIIIYNNIESNSQCENGIPSHSNSVIEYEFNEKTCEDFGRTNGNKCSVSYLDTGSDNMGTTTCVIGYDS